MDHIRTYLERLSRKDFDPFSTDATRYALGLACFRSLVLARTRKQQIDVLRRLASGERALERIVFEDRSEHFAVDLRKGVEHELWHVILSAPRFQRCDEMGRPHDLPCPDHSGRVRFRMATEAPGLLVQTYWTFREPLFVPLAELLYVGRECGLPVEAVAGLPPEPKWFKFRFSRTERAEEEVLALDREQAWDRLQSLDVYSKVTFYGAARPGDWRVEDVVVGDITRSRWTVSKQKAKFIDAVSVGLETALAEKRAVFVRSRYAQRDGDHWRSWTITLHGETAMRTALEDCGRAVQGIDTHLLRFEESHVAIVGLEEEERRAEQSGERSNMHHDGVRGWADSLPGDVVDMATSASTTQAVRSTDTCESR